MEMMERIMNVTEFAEYVREGVRAGLPADLAEADVNIVYGKNDDPQLEIHCPWDTIVRYMLAPEYKAYLSGTHKPEFSIANILNNRSLYHMPIDIRSINVFDFDSMKSRIVGRIMNGGPHNREYLSDRPIKYLEGTQFAMVWDIHCIDIYYKNDIFARMPVTWEMLQAWGISIDELEETARKNTPLLRPAQIIPLKQILMDNGIEIDDCPDMDILVVTNQRKADGAICALYPGVRDTLMEMVEGDVYLLPSSIHECLAVPKEGADLQSLYQMVCEINEQVVDVTEFLADDVLEYTPDGCLVSAMCNQTEEQQIREDCVFA